MDFEYQILKMQNTTIVFLSATHFVVTENLNNLLQTEKVSIIDKNYKIKKSKTAVGTQLFNVKLKKNIIIVNIFDRKIPLDHLIKNAVEYETLQLSTTNKILSFKKNNNYFIAMPNEDNNYLYLNKKNTIRQYDLGNILYLGTLNHYDLIDAVIELNNLHVPFTKVVLDNAIQDTSKFPFSITRVNSLSPNNAFYFINNNSFEPGEFTNKQILTYGLSKNNSKNYFDINMSNNFNELKNYLNFDLNYNKNYFIYKPKKEYNTTIEFTLRLIQFNCVLPVMYVDHNKTSLIDYSNDNYHFKVLRKFLNLRHRILPFLYSGFSSSEDYNINMYSKIENGLIIHKDLLVFPIYTENNKYTNVHFIKMNFDSIYYNLETKEKVSTTIYDYFGINKMPLYAKAGSIIPFTIPNASKQQKYELQIYPNNNNQFLLHYNDREEQGVEHAYTKINLTYTPTKISLTLKTLSNKVLQPKIFRFNFVNIKKNLK